MSRPRVFEYAALRAVPRPERGEFINVGVLLYCQGMDFLAAGTHLDDHRLCAVDPSVDLADVHTAVAAVVSVCAGTPADTAPCRPPLGQRFRWLTAPRSTVLQPGPVHAGLTTDPAAELARLLALLVL